MTCESEKTGLNMSEAKNLLFSMREKNFMGVPMKKACRHFRGMRPSIIGIISMLISSAAVFAEFLDTIHLLKISSQDERAIVKMEDGSMKIIKPGDVIGKRGKVVEITAGRVVFEENTEKGIETVIIRLENGKQRIERIKKTPDKQPVIFKSN